MFNEGIGHNAIKIENWLISNPLICSIPFYVLIADLAKHKVIEKPIDKRSVIYIGIH